MAYQVSKEIGSYSTTLKGKVDRIVLTGGVAHDPNFVAWVKEYVSYLAPVELFPGEEEMKPLALGGLRVLKGEEKAKEYSLPIGF